ncbi:MAG: MFS transporter [Azospirillaceae bacterium]
MATTGTAGATAAPTATPHPRPEAAARWMLPVLLTGQAMAAMDTAIVNVAAPALQADLGLSGAALQLAVAGYGLAYAVFLITGARLGDDHGYKRLFLLGGILFTVSSLACGLAPSAGVLVAGRIAQGVGAALLVPQVLSLIQRSFDGPAKARAIGAYSMILGLGATAGQLLGGLAVALDIGGSSWRAAFLIQVPVGIAVILAARGVVPALKGEVRRALDLIGVVALSASMLAVVVPLTFGRETGWPVWTWALLAAGLAGLWAFWAYERRLTLADGATSPLLDIHAILTPGIRAGLAVVVIGFVGYGGWLFCAALYIQTGLGYSAAISGLVFAAYAAGFGIANLKWSKLPPRLLTWTPAAACAAMAAANLAFAAIALSAGWVGWAMVPLLFLAGSAHGLGFGTAVNRMTTRIAPAHAPALSGLVTTATQLSIVIGIAALGALYLAVAGPLATGASAGPAIAAVTATIAVGALGALAGAIRLATLPVAGESR